MKFLEIPLTSLAMLEIFKDHRNIWKSQILKDYIKANETIGNNSKILKILQKITWSPRSSGSRKKKNQLSKVKIYLTHCCLFRPHDVFILNKRTVELKKKLAKALK